MSVAIRRNVAHLSAADRDAFVAAVRQVDLLSYSDGVSYWDKQDQIHQGTHNHGGPSFIPWHRELCNRFEKLLQQVNPDIALHYWDWTQDPRSADDGQGGTVDLTTNAFFGTANGTVAGVLAPLHNGGAAVGSRNTTGNPADPPQTITRNCSPGAPGVASDATVVNGADALPQPQQWPSFRAAVESAHDTSHLFFGPGSTIRAAHSAFEDPFVFLLHSNVDRMFAMWQTKPGFEWRLDPGQVYGNESATSGSGGTLDELQPWNGTVEFGAPIAPWTGTSTEIAHKNCRDPSVVAPPCYDTLPLTLTQIAPVPGESIRFIDAVENEETARALRLRVRGCRRITCNASLVGDAAYSLLQATVQSPDPSAFETHDVLVWVVLDAGAPLSAPSGTLTVSVPETGDVFTVAIAANVIQKPTVGSVLVLDRSGSMDAASGVGTLTRMEVLRNSAPLFVHLLGDDDGIGTVRFDTDASLAQPVEVAGGQIAGLGRANALAAISTHATNPLGMTAIGDGIEAAANALTNGPTFMHQATVVFTDGHETADKRIAQVADLVGSRVFAVGLGTAEQLNPGALQDIADGTGGFLMLTGNPGPDDQILLQKYFAQIIAGVTNSEVVVDPEGLVLPGGKTAVPFDLTESDRRCDVIVLSPYASLFDVLAEAPDGTILGDGNGAIGVRAPTYQTLRISLPSPNVAGTSVGSWRAILTIDERGFKRVLADLKERKQTAEINRLRAHGVPFTLTVQSRTGVRMAITTTQSSRRPGGTARVAVELTQAGIPLAHAATVTADVTAPGGLMQTVILTEFADGRYAAEFATPGAGVYRILVRAKGATLRGVPFTREGLRTIGVWTRGDDRGDDTAGPAGGLDICGLMTCLIENGALKDAAERAGINLDIVRKCLDRFCR
jgi:Common central domain of tyrosinase/von Willebrand factor type A domain